MSTSAQARPGQTAGPTASATTNSPDNPEVIRAVEDPTPKILDSVTWGFAAVPVYRLEPQWNKYDPLSEPNRPLEPKHVNRLAENMRVAVKIADAPNRICITLNKKEIEECLKESAIQTLFENDRRKYQRVCQEEDTLAKIATEIEVLRDACTKKVSRAVQ